MRKAQPIKHTDLYIGQLVVVTEHPETQVYTVAAIHSQMVTLQWCEGSRQCGQHYEKYGLLKPTLEQIEYSIAANGPLVSTQALALA
jgi:hypothetical protein